MAVTKPVVSEKLAATIQKKNNAIVSAQASALTSAIKTADDAAAFLNNPATFAKKAGISLTASFVSDVKESIEMSALNDNLVAQLSTASAKAFLGAVGKVVEGSGIETDCAHIIVKKKRIRWRDYVIVRKKVRVDCTMKQDIKLTRKARTAK